MTEFAPAGTRTQNPESLTSVQKLKTLIFGVTVPKPQNSIDPGTLKLSFETMTFPSTRGHTLEAWRIASPALPSKTVILFHGYAASKQSLIRTAAKFVDRGYSCFLVDFYGSGNSNGTSTSIGFYEAEDVIASYNYVHSKWPVDQIVVYSVSMGSAAVLRASSEISFHAFALLLESPFDSLLNTTRNRFAAMKIPSLALAELLVFWGGIEQGFNGFDHNPSSYASHTTTPTLLMYGENDARILPAQRASIFNNLGGQKKIVIFEHAGHQMLAEINPQKWAEEVFNFLENVKAKET